MREERQPKAVLFFGCRNPAQDLFLLFGTGLLRGYVLRFAIFVERAQVFWPLQWA